MTITDIAAPADVQLSEHDHVLSRGEREPDLVAFALPWSIGVNLHVRPDTPILVRVYGPEQRVTLRIGGFSAEVDIFLTADQIDRLVDVLTVARQRLTQTL